MPTYKGTLLFQFQEQPPCGFSESFEFNATSDAAAATKLATWPAKRVTWLAANWKIVGFRLSKLSYASVSGKCKKRYTPISVNACVTTPAGLLTAADTPYTAVLAKFTYIDQTFRPRQYLARGIPDTWWTNASLVIPPFDGNKFLEWFNFMKSIGGGGVVSSKGNPAASCSESTSRLDQYCVQRIASRRIGRPFGLLRGRRSKKAVSEA